MLSSWMILKHSCGKWCMSLLMQCLIIFLILNMIAWVLGWKCLNYAENENTEIIHENVSLAMGKFIEIMNILLWAGHDLCWVTRLDYVTLVFSYGGTLMSRDNPYWWARLNCAIPMFLCGRECPSPNTARVR